LKEAVAGRVTLVLLEIELPVAQLCPVDRGFISDIMGDSGSFPCFRVVVVDFN
jgi:hypothetical protein